MRILVIGLSRDLPLGPADAMELADHLVKRAAGVLSDGEMPLLVMGHLMYFYVRYFTFNLLYVYCQTFKKTQRVWRRVHKK